MRRPRRPNDPPIPEDAIGLTARLSRAERARFGVIAEAHRMSSTGFLRHLCQLAIEADERWFRPRKKSRQNSEKSD